MRLHSIVSDCVAHTKRLHCVIHDCVAHTSRLNVHYTSILVLLHPTTFPPPHPTNPTNPAPRPAFPPPPLIPHIPPAPRLPRPPPPPILPSTEAHCNGTHEFVMLVINHGWVLRFGWATRAFSKYLGLSCFHLQPKQF